MRSLFAIWLITLLSLTSLSLVNQPAYLIQDVEPITVEGYWELVRNTQQAITKMEALPEAEIRLQLDDLATQWEKVTAVEFPDQSVLPIDSSYLVTELRNTPPDLQHLKTLLETLLSAHAEYPQNIFTLQDIEPLKTILARPEFQWTETPVTAAPDWLQKMFDAIDKLLARLTAFSLNTAYYGRIPMLIAIVISFMAALYFISRNLSRNLVRYAQMAADGSDIELLSSASAMQRAQTLSVQGDYRTAIRYLYLSSLLTLDEQGLLRYDRSRTNREYLRSIGSKPALAGTLRSVIELFDRVWYGFEEVDEQTYRAYVTHVENLRGNKE